ncbi:lipid-A-disaccharide synthase N-terminal domain-containing protein [Brevundimonas sp.]|uniref:lipid-A-disaccharide synthase N-terminal domain-containing protein n=1 Tax=Brevundimonas sp. TaxID=1871086 RepID=UPI003BA914A1
MTVSVWMLLGVAGQALFSGRFLVQWLASERSGRSVLPIAFWYLSLLGGTALLIYAVHRRDPIFVAGQAAGLAVYARNLHLHLKKTTEQGRGLVTV